MSVTLEARCLLEFLVVQREQQVALLEVVAQVHGEAVHLAVDFGADGHLLGRGDLAGGIDGEVDAAQFNRGGRRALRGGGSGIGFLPVLPAVVAAEANRCNCDQD